MAKAKAAGKVTGGQVVFGITKNLGDYNNRKAEVTLTFLIDEGADASAIIREAGQEAMMHVAEMIAGKKAAAPPADEPDIGKATVDKTAAAKALNDKEAAFKAVEATKKAVEKKLPAGLSVPDTKTKTDEGEDLGEETFNEDEAILDVTDEQLSAELNRTVGRLNKAGHGSKASSIVKALIAEFVEPPKKSHDIPQQQRPQFVQKLKDLK